MQGADRTIRRHYVETGSGRLRLPPVGGIGDLIAQQNDFEAQQEADDEDTIKGEVRLENFHLVANVTERMIQELDRRVSNLPVVVDTSGLCTRDQYEDFYAQKQQAESKLVRVLNRLEQYFPILDSEIARCRSNLDHVRNDSGKLSSPDARNRYLGAEKPLMHQYISACGKRKRAEFLRKKAHLVLKRSREKKWPGGTPRRRQPPPDPQPSSARPPVLLSHRQEAGRDGTAGHHQASNTEEEAERIHPLDL